MLVEYKVCSSSAVTLRTGTWTSERGKEKDSENVSGVLYVWTTKDLLSC